MMARRPLRSSAALVRCPLFAHTPDIEMLSPIARSPPLHRQPIALYSQSRSTPR